MHDNMMEALVKSAEHSLATDKALMKLGESLAMMTTALQDKVEDLEKRIVDLQEKAETLTAMFHTHFGPSADSINQQSH